MPTGKLVKQVLMDIVKKLNNGSLDVAKQRVELKERMDKFKDLLRCPTVRNDKSVRTEQILNELLDLELKVNSVDEGKDRFFGGGSRVIITTRDKHILNLAQANEIYDAEKLEQNQALELFSWHAFLRVCPDQGYEKLSKRVVKACKGFPLSQEVMGAHLYDKKDDKTFWDEAVIRIETLMDKDLDEISFNGLHEEERQIFLDIACFFVGEDKELAISHWKALGCKNPHTTHTNLSLKSLIRIVAEESPEDPCKRSRLWHPDDEISNLRGFKCCDFHNVAPMESLALMKNTQFLWLKNVDLVGKKKTQFLPKLKCLRLRNRCDVLKFPTLLKGLVLANISVLSKLRRISVEGGLQNWHLFQEGSSKLALKGVHS
eukprot:Gb_04749 [translate_table: standard]